MGILSGGDAPTEDRAACVELVLGPADLVARRTLLDRELVLGRDPSCGLVLPDEAIAPRHVRLFRSARGGRYWVQALSSKLPTLLNDAPVTRAVLRDGDIVGLGAVRLRVKLGPG